MNPVPTNPLADDIATVPIEPVLYQFSKKTRTHWESIWSSGKHCIFVQVLALTFLLLQTEHQLIKLQAMFCFKLCTNNEEESTSVVGTCVHDAEQSTYFVCICTGTDAPNRLVFVYTVTNCSVTHIWDSKGIKLLSIIFPQCL